MTSSIATLSEVDQTQPAAGYIGGKRNLARKICAIIAATPHDGYFEPFVGMGGIFLRRTAVPKAEAINDASADVITFFRVLQRHYSYFLDMLRFRVASRAEFNRLAAQRPETLTDLERAARFLYLQRLGFGGKVAGRTFGIDSRQGARFNVLKLEPLLADIHERLASVTIEQLDFGAFIERYDREGALFYLDPPYWGCEEDYGQGVFCRADFQRLAEQLGGLRGRFLMSINDRPGVRETFARFSIEEVRTTYTIGTAQAGAQRVGELLISNYPLPG